MQWLLILPRANSTYVNPSPPLFPLKIALIVVISLNACGLLLLVWTLCEAHKDAIFKSVLCFLGGFDKVIPFVPWEFKAKACSQIIYGSGLFSCIQTPANSGVTFVVRLEAPEIQNMCTDEMQGDHVTIYKNHFLVKPYIRGCINICLLTFTFLNQIPLGTLQLPSHFAGEKLGKYEKVRKIYPFQPVRLPLKAVLNPWVWAFIFAQGSLPSGGMELVYSSHF